jgi:hypothetical protein
MEGIILLNSTYAAAGAHCCTISLLGTGAVNEGDLLAMAAEAGPSGQEQTTLVVKPQLDLWVLVPFAIPMVFAIIGVFFFWGVEAALIMSAIIVACCVAAYLVNRCAGLHRVVLDDEGMTFSSRGIGRLAVRSFHFRWDEVVEVRRPKLVEDGSRLVRLNHPRKFWALHLQPRRAIRIPKGIWANPQVAQAVCAHVPAQKVSADESPPWSARYWWVLVVIILICAGVTAGCSLSVMRAWNVVRSAIAAFTALVIAALAMALCIHRSPRPFRLIEGLVHALILLLLASILVAFLFTGVALAAAWFGAAAGMLVGAAMMIIAGRRSSGWIWAGAALLLAAVELCYGWTGYSQITQTHVCVGSLEAGNPWTPGGDAFLATELSGDSKIIRWYSSGLKLERSVAIPNDAELFVAAQEAALFEIRGGKAAQLWFVSRHAEPRVIDAAPGEGYSYRRWPSADPGHLLIGVYNRESWPLACKICDLRSGEIEPVNFPAPVKDVSVIALLDDRIVLWATGSLPTDNQNRAWHYPDRLPSNGEFAHPGKRYTVWSWKINSGQPPKQIYAAKTQWLEWKRARKPGQLDVCRLSEKAPPHTEFVTLDLSRSPPAERAASGKDFALIWGPWIFESSSHDGRFKLLFGQSDLFYLVDTKTGRRFPMPGGLLNFHGVRWSPTANQFLFERSELKLGDELFSWRHDITDALKERRSIVYFVDMDRR